MARLEFEKLRLYIRMKWWAVFILLVVVLMETLVGSTGLLALFSTYAGLFVVSVINLTLYLFTRKGKFHPSLLHLSLVFDLLIMSAVLYFSGGPENAWWFIPVLVIFTSGYLFNQQIALAYALLAFLILSLVFGLEYSRLVPHYPVYALPSAHWMNRVFLSDYALGMLVLYSMGALISGYFNRLMQESHDQIEKNLASAIAAKEEAEASRRALAKRTEDLEKARKAIQHMLKDLKEDVIKLQAIDRMKTEFLSMVSHELRTPITPIKGYLSLLLAEKMGKLSPKIKNALGILSKQNDHLHTLIDSLLDISRLELGKPIPTSKEPIAMKALLQSVTDAMKIQAEEKEQKLSVELPEELPTLLADGIKIKRILTNLIGNAILFTPKGGEIKVRAFVKDSKMRVEVIDNGIGIAKDNLEKIFEKFFQVDSSFTRAAGGIGMGLTLARELVKLHGGELWAESEGPGKGCKFIFTLPIT